MGLKVVTPERAAIYARFSTDLQSDRSIDDQVALCRAYAESRGWRVAAIFSDRARSGASLFGRAGLARLVEAAAAGGFAVVVAESADRLSRDIADLAGLHKQLDFRGIAIDCVNGGRLDTLSVGLHGLVGQMQREEGARKVRRGMAGVAREGRHAGGRPYGYRPVPGRPGELAVVAAEAAVVRRIFERYVAGEPPRAIASALNAEGVPPPRGGAWNASTINGNLARGHGIVLNEVYAGRLVWNRVRMVKDPATGKRVSRPNPRSEWIAADAPRLAIVPAELFAAAQARKRREGRASRPGPRPKRLLSGLLRCGACGAGMHAIGADRKGVRVQCARVRESGDCGHGRRYYLADVERLVVEGLRAELRDPSALAEYAKTYHEERRALAAAARRGRAGIERRLAEAERRIARLIDLAAEGAIGADDLRARLPALKAERGRLEAERAAAARDDAPIALHPQALATYARDLDRLSDSLNAPFAAAAADAFRALVERVTIAPSAGGEPVVLQVEGRLAALLDHALFPTRRLSGGSLVAEVRFGGAPPTFLLRIA
jgi:site-specific DNA recombinase